MKNITTPIDNVFKFIEANSQVRESSMPEKLKGHEDFEKHINFLMDKEMIE